MSDLAADMCHPAAPLRECATPRLHDEVFASLSRIFPSGCGPVLDLGGGTGAWSNRLLRSGYRDIIAMDLDEPQFRGDAQFIKGDLNHDFSRCLPPGKFRLITALELIEHLENPAHFLRQCASLLAPEGILVLTTPNIESMPSRLKFLLQGRLRHFDQNGDPTHITPIDTYLLGRLAGKAGLKIHDRVPLVRYWHDRRPLFIAVAAALALFMKGSPYGACHLFVLRHDAL